MTRKEWADIQAAAELLGLGDNASLADIKKAHRRLSKKYHPDMQKNAKHKAGKDAMLKVTEAYQILLDYCAKYRFPLKPDGNELLEGDDWWFERFGQDHLWGKKSEAEKDTKK